MQPSNMLYLQQDHVERLRLACRRGDGGRAHRTALYLREGPKVGRLLWEAVRPLAPTGWSLHNRGVHYITEGIDAAELDRRRALYIPLTDAVRDLIDATIRTEVDDAVITQVREEIAAATAKLRAKQLTGTYGLRKTPGGETVSWGNVAVGLHNAIAPPIMVESSEDGLHWADLTLGTAYEGPTGLVHGGMGALILDHVLGATANSVTPSFTGTLTLRYRRGTPLGKLRAEARVDRTEGRKIIVLGTLSDAEGVTIEAEGIFIGAPAV